jgi:hypothetical protein
MLNLRTPPLYKWGLRYSVEFTRLKIRQAVQEEFFCCFGAWIFEGYLTLNIGNTLNTKENRTPKYFQSDISLIALCNAQQLSQLTAFTLLSYREISPNCTLSKAKHLSAFWNSLIQYTHCGSYISTLISSYPLHLYILPWMFLKLNALCPIPLA